MANVLVVMQQRGEQWHPVSLEALEAGRHLAAILGTSCDALVMGPGASKLAASLTAQRLQNIYTAEHDLLAAYTPDAYKSVLTAVIDRLAPSHIVFPHTYQVRDFAPALATSFGLVFLSDVTAIKPGPSYVRQLFGGKLNAEYATRERFTFLSVQAGAFRVPAAENAPEAGASTAITAIDVTLTPAMIRTTPGEPFREAAQTVDLTAAPVIVSVGRGIGEQDNLRIVEELATALGAELAASRPICDNGWLPMERQVGSSGQTVAPKLYLAVGISGAIQHLVGMKGAKTVIAINKDPDAPIFEVADIGVVGDLFEIVPALTRAIKG